MKLKTGRFLPFLLLIIFLTFSLCQLHHSIASHHIQESYKFVVNDKADEALLFKNEEKKKTHLSTVQAITFNISVVHYVLITMLLSFCFIKLKIFSLPVFYQSNYVIALP